MKSTPSDHEGPAPDPLADEPRKLVHKLRNSLFAIICAAEALKLARTDEVQFDALHVAMKVHLDEFKGLIAHAAVLLESKS